jgi:hypothetical protein
MPRPTPTPAPRRTTTATASHAHQDEGTVRFSMVNWVLLLAGLVAIVAGYVALSGGSTVAAPLLLVLGYVVLLPLGIIK